MKLKLQFHSQNLDPTKMHERLGIGYLEKWVFLHHVPFTPDSSVNGQFNGIYALTEQIDGRLARENFTMEPEIHKEIWPITNSGAASRTITKRTKNERR